MWCYENASALIITFIVNNHVDDSKNVDAEAWEAKFIAFLKNYKGGELQHLLLIRGESSSRQPSVITESSGLTRDTVSLLKTPLH